MKKEFSTTLLARCLPSCYAVTSADETQSCNYNQLPKHADLRDEEPRLSLGCCVQVSCTTKIEEVACTLT